jgi:hypothetical protein
MLKRPETGNSVVAEGAHINFCSLGRTDERKTNIYEVFSKEGNYLLGRIKWYGRWRKYIFEPCDGTLYEEVCMRDISQFIEEETKEHREQAKRARA